MSRGHAPAPALVRLFEAAGYRVEVRTEGTLATRPRDHRAVAIVSVPRSPADLESWFPADAVRRTIVYDDEPGPVVREIAAERGVEVIDPSTLGPALGELLLPPPAPPGANAPMTEAAQLDAPFPLAPDTERTVRPRVGRTDAEVLAGVDGPRFTLRLVPFYVAEYRVREASAYGEAGPVVHQLVAVNAVTRRAEVWTDGDRELITELEEPHQRLAPILTESQARPVAVEAIRKVHTVHVDHTEQHGGALVIETRRVPPSSGDVRVGPFALLFVPHWYAEGAEGRVVLDAVTGRRATAPEAGG